MKYNFSDIKEGCPIVLMLHSGSVHMKMDAVIDRLIRDDIAFITLQTTTTQILKFDDIDIEVIYTSSDGYPYMWHKAQIVYFKGNYVLQVKGDGTRHNRRCTYRVAVSKTARLYTLDEQIHRIIVKDVSLNGFGITDRNRDLNFTPGTVATLMFEDLGFFIDLQGVVIRIEEHDDYVVYGFTIQRSCKDLPNYITTKQGQRHNTLPPSYVLNPNNGEDK